MQFHKYKKFYERSMGSDFSYMGLAWLAFLINQALIKRYIILGNKIGVSSVFEKIYLEKWKKSNF